LRAKARDVRHCNYTARVPNLTDESPQGRRIAAIELGKRGGDGAVASLRAALDAEEVAWVRPSMILALGKIGGEEARAALAEIEPRSDAEAEALRKARDRVSGPATGFEWREDAAIERLFASVPIGLEDVAIAEAREHGIEASFVRRGTIALPARPPVLRCIYDVRILIAEGAAGAFAETVKQAEVRWREWIRSESDTLPYRFSLANVRVTKQEFNDLLRVARETFSMQGLVDSPSSYAAMLRVEADPDATRIWLVPTFERDERFAYRVADVGASINPVVGACLARLVRRGDGGLIVDPTCGSGTLLIERALLDGGATLAGIDISPTAIRAATENVIAAGLAARIAVRQGDGGDPAAWPDRCDEVLANLPFGMRTEDRNLDGLYRRIVGNIARTLAPGGRALLYTAHGKTLIALLRRTTKLRVIEERRVESGGLTVGVWILERR
jgi:23S rRNA G2445 N2-methylase RlmL